MTRSRSERVICICRKCHPGKKVALRTRQEHYQLNGQPKITKSLSGRSIILSDSGTNGGGHGDTEMEDDSIDEEEIDDFTGIRLMIILTIKTRRTLTRMKAIITKTLNKLLTTWASPTNRIMTPDHKIPMELMGWRCS